MANYDAISKAVSTAVKREVDKQIKAAYKRGYQKGYSEEYEARQSAVDIAYKRGLNDAWKCARKLSHTRPQAEWNKLCELFGVAENRAYTIFEKCTASEAIAKIKEYEEKQTEKNCENCECFGDITECKKRPCYALSCWTPKQDEIHCNATDKEITESFIEDVSAVKDQLPYKNENSYRNNKYYNTFPTSKETADEIKAEYDEETRSYIYTVEGKKE